MGSVGRQATQLASKFEGNKTCREATMCKDVFQILESGRHAVQPFVNSTRSETQRNEPTRFHSLARTPIAMEGILPGTQQCRLCSSDSTLRRHLPQRNARCSRG